MLTGRLLQRFEMWKTRAQERGFVRATRRSSRSPRATDAIEQLEDRRLLSATNFVPFIGPQMGSAPQLAPLQTPVTHLPTGPTLPGSGLPGATANLQEYNGHYSGALTGTLTITRGRDDGVYNFTGNIDITVKDGAVTVKLFALVNSDWRLVGTETGTIDRLGFFRSNGPTTLTIPTQGGGSVVLHGTSTTLAFHLSPGGGRFVGSVAGNGNDSETFRLNAEFNADRV